jgi:exodeoxyribonuclease VII large subunit
MDTQPTNTPEFTVSEVSGAVKRTLETNFSRIRVRGELTEVKRYPSGHIYLSLKDENAKIAGVVWKNAVSRLGMVPENGTEVIATGRISAYGERSSYQLIIERMEYAGVGALLARIEQIRQRLTAEGLFDPARKQPLPALPRVIGVVTSAPRSSAASPAASCFGPSPSKARAPRKPSQPPSPPSTPCRPTETPLAPTS